MKKIYNIVRTTFLVISLVVILGTVTMLGLDIHPYIIVSGSMEPAIMTGSLCFVNYNDRDVDVGDIIAYRAGDKTVTHRVIDKSADGYVTKGDGNDAADISPVTEDRIIGTDIFNIPKLGYAIMALKSAKGIMITLVLFTGYFLAGIFIERRVK